MATVVGKSAYDRWEEGFTSAFMKKAEKPPETNEDRTVSGTQDVQGEDPGEVTDEWDGEDPEQYSPNVKKRDEDTRDGILERSFVAPPSPKGQFRKVSHAVPTVQEQVRSLFDRR